METHYPHPYDPKNKARILRIWKEIRIPINPITVEKSTKLAYEGTYIEYTYRNKKGKEVHVPEFCMLVEWIGAL